MALRERWGEARAKSAAVVSCLYESTWPGTALVHKGHGFWSAHIARFNPFDSKAGRLDQFTDWAIEVTPAADAAPDWRKAILPAPDTRIR